MRRCGRAGLSGVLVALGLGGCAGGGGGRAADLVAGPGARPVPASLDAKGYRPLSVKRGGTMPPLPYLDGRVVRERAGAAGTPIAVDGALGCIGSPAVRLRDGRLLVTRVVARRSARADVPRRRVRLEIVHPEVPRPTVLADPACNPAVSRTGQVAYVAGEPTTASAGDNHRGRITVRRTPASPPEPWTGSAAWCSLTWAGSRLLAKTCDAEGYGGALYVLDGPGRRRMIGRPPRGDDQPSARVIAVSPDGELAAITGERLVPRAVHPTVSIVRLADGRVLAALDTERAIGAGLVAGQWRGARIVAVTGYCCGGNVTPPPSIVLLRWHAGRLTLRRVAPIGYEDVGEQTQSRPGAYQPRLLGPDTVGVWLYGVDTRWLTCDLSASACRAGPAVRSPSGERAGAGPRLVTQAQQTG